MAEPRKLLLMNRLCPGDCLVMSAALECLHSRYPGRYVTDVDTSCNAIFENNPHVTKLERSQVEPLDMQYPLIHNSNQRPIHFIEAYADHLRRLLSVELPCTVNRPYLYLSDEEKGWVNQVQETTGYKGKFWLICSGIKADYTVKGYGLANYQAVVDYFKGKVQFVQVGESGHNHPPLSGVINLVGKTDARQLIRLAYHASGGLGGVSFLHHIFAALEKPFVCVASGMEPKSWEAYNTEVYLTRQGQLPCCKSGGCWKARTVKLGDKDGKDGNLCELPIFATEPLPKCMAMIRPQEVIDAIMAYYLGGLLSF